MRPRVKPEDGHVTPAFCDSIVHVYSKHMSFDRVACLQCYRPCVYHNLRVPPGVTPGEMSVQSRDRELLIHNAEIKSSNICRSMGDRQASLIKRQATVCSMLCSSHATVGCRNLCDVMSGYNDHDFS